MNATDKAFYDVFTKYMEIQDISKLVTLLGPTDGDCPFSNRLYDALDRYCQGEGVEPGEYLLVDVAVGNGWQTLKCGGIHFYEE